MKDVDIKKGFSVYSLTTFEEGMENNYTHWSEGLTMYLTKDGVTMKLTSDEIELLVKSLPRTIGGSY